MERNDGTISVIEKWESFGLESIEYMHEETPEFPVVIMTNTPDKSKESQYTDADKVYAKKVFLKSEFDAMEDEHQVGQLITELSKFYGLSKQATKMRMCESGFYKMIIT